ncbi:hypothetical protein EC991_007016 [Linnemannia zychae]|nr:hypothetical protein EC991_007016 [Linnemannia zychae]
MMAHASSADAPLDSEVSTADLDSEAFATTPSATTPTLDIDILAQLMDTTTTTTTENSTDILLSDHSILALASTATPSTSWTSSPSISPRVLKLESPLLSHLEIPSSSKKSSSTRRASTSSTSTANINSRKRSAVDPADKEAKARERVLRNRAAAQESRDKKRKYVAEIEASNESLQQENCQLLKRLKTVESDNLSLHQRLETLTAQFAQMQQQLSSSFLNVKQNNNNNQPGVGFCQSAVLAKKDRRSRKTDNLTNSPQQKLAPTQRNPHTTISTPNKHRRVSSMTMKTSMTSKTNLNRAARSLSDPSAAPQTWMEISCRPFCNNINNSCRRKKALTLSSSAAASFPAAATTPATSVACMMAFLANTLLPQLMLNFSILFLISTGAQSSNPQLPLPQLPQQEQELRQAVLSFIQQQQLQQQLSNGTIEPHRTLVAPPLGSNPNYSQSRTIKDNITSLDPSVIEEIVTEFRQGRKQVARGLLVRALVSSRLTLDPTAICKRLSLLLYKK